ncbi:polysaccharide lyase 6 family protein [Paenibacillus sp. PL91]|uniref:polysaccharide lyase 6 family protein n=1 Tax=Paenibacillus sp. PL91 TaxID=2729538 RepID=UPI00145D8A10|nr:polysaccharide lyase 6 family protein [Paenibacillus sp. PL91]MBC9201199.1 hypothetical protein [Paenibacillus sp. PL91]
MRVSRLICLIQIFCLAALVWSLPVSGSAGVNEEVAETSSNVHVSNTDELESAINDAAPGTTILLADGTYDRSGSFRIEGKHGDESSPITIMAANQGQATITGRAGFSVINSSHVVLRGMKFTGESTAISINNSHHVRLTRNTFALAPTSNPSGLKWVQLTGDENHHNRIDRNEFGPRTDLGQMIAFQGKVMSQYDVIEYNYFHDAAHQSLNGGETIRVGLSGSSMSNGFATIQYNLFVNLNSDPEVISVKSGNNTVRYNTFIDNRGQVTARHGHKNSYYGNYFFRTGDKPNVGGFRIYGNDHKIYNNYFHNINNAIHIDGANYDAGPDGSQYDSTVLTRHWRVYRAQVFHNTIVNGTLGIVVGKSYVYGPVDSVVANNIVIGTGGSLYSDVKSTNTFYEGNIGYGDVLSDVPRSTSEIWEVDPLLVSQNGLYRLTSESPAIDAATGSYPLEVDMDGQPRAVSDIGADEYAMGPVRTQPITTAEVGPNALTHLTAQAEGTQTASGWYTSSVAVKLEAINAETGAGRLEFRLNDSDEWLESPSGNPIMLTEDGQNKLSYRYVNEGIAEPEKELIIAIDRDAPSFQLLGNGASIGEATSFADTENLALELQAEDAGSGISAQTFSWGDDVYETSALIPLTGRLGEHVIKVSVIDAAGHAAEAVYHISVTPTFETLQGLLAQYINAGTVSGPSVNQLSNSLRQALHHYELSNASGSIKQAVKFLDKFAEYAENAHAAQISPEAKESLVGYAAALTAFLQK